MNIYRISLINKRLNFRKMLDITAVSCLEAINAAKAFLGKEYSVVESAYCIAVK